MRPIGILVKSLLLFFFLLFVSKVENKIFQIEKYKNVQNFIHNKMQKLINDGKKIKNIE